MVNRGSWTILPPLAVEFCEPACGIWQNLPWKTVGPSRNAVTSPGKTLQVWDCSCLRMKERGRPHREWSDDIEQWYGATLQELSHAALDRQRWAAIVTMASDTNRRWAHGCRWWWCYDEDGALAGFRGWDQARWSSWCWKFLSIYRTEQRLKVDVLNENNCLQFLCDSDNLPLLLTDGNRPVRPYLESSLVKHLYCELPGRLYSLWIHTTFHILERSHFKRGC